MLKEDRENHRCILCGTTAAKHSSWDYECPVRMRQVEAAKLAYSTRPAFFQERPAGGVVGQVPAAYRSPLKATTAPAPTTATATAPTTATASTTTSTPTPVSAPPTSTPTEAAHYSCTALERTIQLYSERPWQIVGSKRNPSLQGTAELQAKRPQGRPQGSTNAACNTADIRSF
jgi:hypothetical protein